jgi:hypothetical protein
MSSPLISRVAVSRNSRLVKREVGSAYKVLPETIKRRGHLGILGVDGKMGARGRVVG